MSENGPALPTRPPRRSARIWHFLRPRLTFAVLLLLVVWAYFPARTRYFASDQLIYLAELNGDDDLKTASHGPDDIAVEEAFSAIEQLVDTGKQKGFVTG